MLSSVTNFQANGYQDTRYKMGTSTVKDAPSNVAPTNPEIKADQNQAPKTNLSPEQIQELTQLKARDRDVRAHEQAHLSAAGSIALSGASFSYRQGPDGNQYAIGGEVNIDTSPVAGDPQATLSKADTIRRAAFAPVQPSAQDLKVAEAAAKMAMKAQSELLHQNQYSQVSGIKSSESNLGSNINYSV